jgi:hypothetical protein
LNIDESAQATEEGATQQTFLVEGVPQFIPSWASASAAQPAATSPSQQQPQPHANAAHFQGKMAFQGCADNEQPMVVVRDLPLIDYLCTLMRCSQRELQVHFLNVDSRRFMLEHVRPLRLRTTHLKCNVAVRCNDFSTQSAAATMAMNGYLGITVRQFYYVRHQRRLRHPYMPCVVEWGTRGHRSYFPLEVLTVQLNVCDGAAQ